eukprot:g7313.t1
MGSTIFKVGLAALYLHGVTAAPVADILDDHNEYRALHDADPLTYSDDLETDAQTYADVLASDCGSFDHDPDLSGQGENLYTCASTAMNSACSTGYTPPGNFRGQYYDNVSILCDDVSECDAAGRGEICCPVKKVCEVPDPATPNACGDPHMTGFLGQKFDFTGLDGAWYSVVSDISDDAERPSTHINMRVTSPVAELPEITYITGLSIITTDDDGLEHSIVIQVTEPHSLDSSCPEGASPCLADGALTVEIDGEETLLAPDAVEVGSGVAVSAVNLPGACRSFGFEKYWEAKQEAYVKAGRKLSAASDLQNMSEWILGDPTATNMDECTEYVAGAIAGGEDGLFSHDSEHASFQIVTPGAVIRLSHGRLHQLPMRDPTNQFELPEHRTWQMNLALERNTLSSEASGILGETQVPTVDASGQPIMEGMESIRGTQEAYRVEGPLDVVFAQGSHKG